MPASAQLLPAPHPARLDNSSSFSNDAWSHQPAPLATHDLNFQRERAESERLRERVSQLFREKQALEDEIELINVENDQRQREKDAVNAKKLAELHKDLDFRLFEFKEETARRAAAEDRARSAEEALRGASAQASKGGMDAVMVENDSVMSPSLLQSDVAQAPSARMPRSVRSRASAGDGAMPSRPVDEERPARSADLEGVMSSFAFEVAVLQGRVPGWDSLECGREAPVPSAEAALAALSRGPSFIIPAMGDDAVSFMQAVAVRCFSALSGPRAESPSLAAAEALRAVLDTLEIAPMGSALQMAALRVGRALLSLPSSKRENSVPDRALFEMIDGDGRASPLCVTVDDRDTRTVAVPGNIALLQRGMAAAAEFAECAVRAARSPQHEHHTLTLFSFSAAWLSFIEAVLDNSQPGGMLPIDRTDASEPLYSQLSELSARVLALAASSLHAATAASGTLIAPFSFEGRAEGVPFAARGARAGSFLGKLSEAELVAFSGAVIAFTLAGVGAGVALVSFVLCSHSGSFVLAEPVLASLSRVVDVTSIFSSDAIFYGGSHFFIESLEGMSHVQAAAVEGMHHIVEAGERHGWAALLGLRLRASQPLEEVEAAGNKDEAASKRRYGLRPEVSSSPTSAPEIYAPACNPDCAVALTLVGIALSSRAAESTRISDAVAVASSQADEIEEAFYASRGSDRVRLTALAAASRAAATACAAFLASAHARYSTDSDFNVASDDGATTALSIRGLEDALRVSASLVKITADEAVDGSASSFSWASIVFSSPSAIIAGFPAGTLDGGFEVA